MSNTAATSQQDADAILLDARPPRGRWKEADYLRLTDRCNRLVEFADGCIEELREPTDSHQSILMLLFRLFDERLRTENGVALVAPLRLRIREGRFREPDLMVLLDAADSRRQDRYWLGADIVVEVVSPDDPERDYGRKRADYADVRIPEYWIVDPQATKITVLAFDSDGYVNHGVFGPGDDASSAVLSGFEFPVSSVFDTRALG